jgi:hypothetical protein
MRRRIRKVCFRFSFFSFLFFSISPVADPYLTPDSEAMLIEQTGLSYKKIGAWLSNARSRYKKAHGTVPWELAGLTI